VRWAASCSRCLSVRVSLSSGQCDQPLPVARRRHVLQLLFPFRNTLAPKGPTTCELSTIANANLAIQPTGTLWDLGIRLSHCATPPSGVKTNDPCTARSLSSHCGKSSPSMRLLPFERQYEVSRVALLFRSHFELGGFQSSSSSFSASPITPHAFCA
jgi:hypothetical protein